MEEDSVENTTLMYLDQMIDTALGTTQPNVIHFNLLNKILKIIIKHVELDNVRVQLSGESSEEIRRLSSQMESYDYYGKDDGARKEKHRRKRQTEKLEAIDEDSEKTIGSDGSDEEEFMEESEDREERSKQPSSKEKQKLSELRLERQRSRGSPSKQKSHEEKERSSKSERSEKSKSPVKQKTSDEKSDKQKPSRGPSPVKPKTSSEEKSKQPRTSTASQKSLESTTDKRSPQSLDKKSSVSSAGRKSPSIASSTISHKPSIASSERRSPSIGSSRQAETGKKASSSISSERKSPAREKSDKKSPSRASTDSRKQADKDKDKDKGKKQQTAGQKALRKRSESIIVMDDDDEPKPVEHTVIITTEQVQYLFDTIEELKKTVSEMKYLPNNKDLLDRIASIQSSSSGSSNKSPEAEKSEKSERSEKASRKDSILSRHSGGSPIVDMYQMLTIIKRIDGIEEGMIKLASLIEDLAKEVHVPSAPGVETPETGGKRGKKDIIKGARGGVGVGSGSGKEEIEKVENINEVVSLADLRGASAAILGTRDALDLLTRELLKVKQVVIGDTVSVHDEFVKPDNNMVSKMLFLEVKMKQALDQVYALDRYTAERLENITGRCEGFDNSIMYMRKIIEDSLEDSKAPWAQMGDKFNKMEVFISKMNEEYKKISANERERAMQMSAVIEQLEMLKISKIGQEQFVNALSTKLDSEELNRKVSYDRFNMTYDDLKNNLDEAFDRLSEQEALWNRALVEIQTEMMNKMEKNEIKSLQNFIKEKLTRIQKKLREVKDYQHDTKAAAAKQQLLKNLKCISCDKDVVMTKTTTSADYPKPAGLPPTKNIAPYLAYELDQLRKQKNQMSSRNLHHFESALKKNKLDNRYCGGPHTTTTPAQRVTRVGHFLEQWGPDIVVPCDILIKGKDGNVYLGNDSPKNASKTDFSREERPSVAIDKPEKDNESIQKESHVKDSINEDERIIEHFTRKSNQDQQHSLGESDL